LKPIIGGAHHHALLFRDKQKKGVCGRTVRIYKQQRVKLEKLAQKTNKKMGQA